MTARYDMKDVVRVNDSMSNETAAIDEFFLIANYREACLYLQNKYDALGLTRKSYYHEKDGHLIKTSGTGCGDKGLQYHHICEDQVPSLSSLEVATKHYAEHPEYQAAENMCYCNLLEHAWLHILITEAAVKNSDEAEDECLGNHGAKWMFLALNSVLANPEDSWYSKRGEILENLKDDEKAELENVLKEVKGMTYNYNNIITDNEKTYRYLVNRYCTSAFIRLKLGKTSTELCDELGHLFCKKDTGANRIRNIINYESKQSMLFDCNVGAFVDTEMYLRENRAALINICTGGGKTTTALEYCRVHNCKALVLGPKDVVGDSWKASEELATKNPEAARFLKEHIVYVNYQTFMNNYKDYDYSEFGVIIADEAHHTKADRWSEGIDWVLANTKLPIIGLTATLSKEQANGTDDIFQGRIAKGLDVAEGIEGGHIWSFGYVQSIFGFAENEDLKKQFEAAGSTGTLLWGRLNTSLNMNPIERILRDNMPSGIRKIVCFAQSIKDEEPAINALKAYNPELLIYVIDSKQSYCVNNRNEILTCDEIRRIFNAEKTKDICLVNVGMVSEGAHYDGVNTLVMFRRTRSITLYLQQLGRIICTTKKENPNAIVFDFTNNAETLIHNGNSADNIVIGKVKDALKKAAEKSRIENEGTELIFRDYTEDCVNILSQLKESMSNDIMVTKIFNKVTDNLATENLEEYFSLELWEDLKASQAQTTNSRGRSKRATNTSIQRNREDALAEANITSSTIKSSKTKASDKEKIAKAFTLICRWAYINGILTFADDQKATASITDKNTFEEICNRYGFKKSELVENTISSMSISCYNLVNNF